MARRAAVTGFCAGLILGGAAAGPAAAAPVRYVLDPAQTFVTFEVRHFGTSTLRGRLGPVQGVVMLDRAARRGDLGLTIDVGSLSTGFGPLDARLRAPDLLAAGEYPQAYFVAANFEFDAAGAVSTVRGEFTLRGISVPLTLKADHFGCRQDVPAQREVCGGDFSGQLQRSAFGASFGLPFVSDSVRLVVQAEGMAEPPPPR